jgi:hypothetical protein
VIRHKATVLPLYEGSPSVSAEKEPTRPPDPKILRVLAQSRDEDDHLCILITELADAYLSSYTKL